MPEVLVRVAAVVLAVTFAWAALAKLVRFASWRDALARYVLPGAVRAVALPAVPLTEVAVVVLLLAGATKAGAALALALLASFSLTLFAAHDGDSARVPCGCFGRATERDLRVMLLRNGVLTALGGTVLSGPEVALAEGWRMPASSDALPVALVALGIALVVFVGWQVEQASRRGRR